MAQVGKEAVKTSRIREAQSRDKAVVKVITSTYISNSTTNTRTTQLFSHIASRTLDSTWKNFSVK
jgi:hypothetical protein